MKKFLLFGGEYYYPDGGWNDFIGSYDSVEDALVAVADPSTDDARRWSGPRDWWHVIDRDTGEKVKSGD